MRYAIAYVILFVGLMTLVDRVSPFHPAPYKVSPVATFGDCFDHKGYAHEKCISDRVTLWDSHRVASK